ncbi:C-terminal binding protein [Paenibacillus psychroresistens]|uniref:C-terminal binding protein n=1 Tax=Paenibacillus psychroresistens TaxID=1778678 RepID=A0A6B8RD82_9BACL|nr:C-terminal binding protein [Paenibacillus psychroresistens]QGQ94110.1 C-terminal binding protein [Paenibacillus psychroresistens]
MKAYITPHDFPNLDQETKMLAELGVELELINSVDPKVIAEKAKDGVALFVQYTKIPQETIEQLDQCKIILRYGIGYDNIDLQAAGKKGIYVSNVPHYCGDEVADHTLAFMLTAARKLIAINAGVHAGGWSFMQHRPIYSLARKTLGLIGCGYIAQKVASRAKAFGMDIVAYDPWLAQDKAAAMGIELVSLEELCARADFVSLHLPLSAETYHFVNKALVAKMKDSVIIMNTARGALVNAADMREALLDNKIGMICLDVLETEPPEANHPLIGLEGAILTPHSAYYSEESLPALQKMAVEEVARVIRGERPLSPVNLKWWV